ncbi:MAG: hypothetical protein E6556_02240 [Pantoea sp.]|jgi:hypothetical protein|uniref:hypothetical protein n=2 Tax=Erwiniaceae TaxID=1903409 RepID=UPI0028A73C94|nr:hypothetical protein [Pantoea piersonii]MDU6431787.1 hypothetical protein [Pantoea sp.]
MVKAFMKKILLLILPLFLASCANYKWVKEGASDRDETVVETACQAQALRDLPPDNQVSGKTVSQDKKNGESDVSYTLSDSNASQRDILVKDCMYQKGWTQIEVQQ